MNPITTIGGYLAKVRVFNPDNRPEDADAPLEVNARNELLVVQALPALAELVRLGGSYHALSSAVAAKTAVPTTTAGFSLWNGEPDGPNGKSYIIDSFGCVEIVTDATQQNSLALFAMMNKGKQAAPTDDGLVCGSMVGNTYAGKAKKAVGVTVVNDIWTPHGPSTPGNTAFAGAVWRVTEFNAMGLYIVSPSGQFSIAAAKTVATASQLQYFIRWHEVRIPVAA